MVASTLREQLGASLTVIAPKSAFEMREEAGRRYDGQIPAEVMGAIAAREQEQRDAARTAGMSDRDRLRFYSAKEFGLAKGFFRTLCRMMRQGYFTRETDPRSSFQVLRSRARTEALAHLEAWAMLRHQERRSAGRRAAE